MNYFLSLLLCLSCCACNSQPGVARSVSYPANRILGDSIALQHFFRALQGLEADSAKTVSIVHIGDSHLQADYFSGMLRVLLQERFGNAGRGLIFPYRIAHTNEPVNYSSSALSEWKGVRNVINPNQEDIGVSGIAAFSKTATADFSILLKDQGTLNYAFNSVGLFSTSCYPENTRLTSHGRLVPAEPKEAPFLLSFRLPDTSHAFSFRFSGMKPADIHGVLLKNDQKGILYHTIGVNGATFKDYNNSSLFLEQLKSLKPDLIIVSLGTNESYAGRFDVKKMEQEADRLISNLRLVCGSCSVLLTTPADNCRLKKGKAFHNERPAIIGAFLKSYAADHHLAVWDLYEVMGGRQSMPQWKRQGLAAKDYVHFTRKGYERQGSLLFEALMKRYTELN